LPAGGEPRGGRRPFESETHGDARLRVLDTRFAVCGPGQRDHRRSLRVAPERHERRLRKADAHGQELRASGMSNRKAGTLRALAERFLDGELSDESLARMSDGEIEAELTEIPGIGPWTAHGFLIFALDRPDVLLSGDLALRRAVQHAYGFDHLPTDEEMLQVAERWRPYRSLAVSYLFASEKGT